MDFILIYMTKNFTQLWASVFTKTVVCAYCPTVIEEVFWSPEFLSEMLDELSLIFFFFAKIAYRWPDSRKHTEN